LADGNFKDSITKWRHARAMLKCSITSRLKSASQKVTLI